MDMDVIGAMFADIDQKRKDLAELVDTYYDQKLLDTLYLYEASSFVRLSDVCTPEFRELLFNHPVEPLFKKDELSETRSSIFGDRAHIQSLYFRDPSVMSFLNFQTSVDVVGSKKSVSPQLKAALSSVGYSPECVLDFEVFEFPHASSFAYYGIKQSETVKHLDTILDTSSKDIAKAFRLKNGPLYRDTEKIHVQYVALKDKADLQFIPFYIGIGTNEISNFTFPGAFGKSRFVKYKFDGTDATGFEQGVVNVKSFNPANFTELFPDCTLLELLRFDGAQTFSVLKNRPPELLGYDDLQRGRHEGFIQMYAKGMAQLTPRFASTSFSTQDYFRAIKSGVQEINGLPIIRSSNDIFDLLESSLSQYERFAALQYDPLHMVQKFGTSRVHSQIENKLDCGEYIFPDTINVASDVAALSLEAYDRLKFASLVLGNYLTSGRMDEILVDLYNSNP